MSTLYNNKTLDMMIKLLLTYNPLGNLKCLWRCHLPSRFRPGQQQSSYQVQITSVGLSQPTLSLDRQIKMLKF